MQHGWARWVHCVQAGLGWGRQAGTPGTFMAGSQNVCLDGGGLPLPSALRAAAPNNPCAGILFVESADLAGVRGCK